MPKAEILSIGTELLLGQIINSNSQFIASQLSEIGIDCCWQTTVGDNKQRIKESIRQALNRVDILIVTGGLGPTADDLTCESLAELFEVPLIFDQATLDKIERMFQERGMVMPKSNYKQALRPRGSLILSNPVGTAPGIAWELSDQALLKEAGLEMRERARLILTFPGVPTEMKVMWQETARSILQERFGDSVIWSCDLKHYGIGESALAEMHQHLLGGANPTVAPLAGHGECRLRVTAKSKTIDQARKLAKPIIDEIRANSGKLCYGLDEDTLELVVGALLVERQQTIAVAESCTGGLVSKLLTDISGSSRYVKLNLVAYADEVKREILGVHQYILQTKGAVSPECAHAMAAGIRKLSGADIGVGITGIAGPGGGTDAKPVGLVYLALVTKNVRIDKTLKLSSNLSRKEIRFRTAKETLNMVRLYLLDELVSTQ